MNRRGSTSIAAMLLLPSDLTTSLPPDHNGFGTDPSVSVDAFRESCLYTWDGKPSRAVTQLVSEQRNCGARGCWLRPLGYSPGDQGERARERESRYATPSAGSHPRSPSGRWCRRRGG